MFVSTASAVYDYSPSVCRLEDWSRRSDDASLLCWSRTGRVNGFAVYEGYAPLLAGLEGRLREVLSDTLRYFIIIPAAGML